MNTGDIRKKYIHMHTHSSHFSSLCVQINYKTPVTLSLVFAKLKKLRHKNRDMKHGWVFL